MYNVNGPEAKTGLFGFVAGVAVGAIAGILYAPKEGAETRGYLTDQVSKLISDTQKSIDDASSAIKQQKDQLTEAAKSKKPITTQEAQESNAELTAKISKLEKRLVEVEADLDAVENAVS